MVMLAERPVARLAAGTAVVAALGAAVAQRPHRHAQPAPVPLPLIDPQPVEAAAPPEAVTSVEIAPAPPPDPWLYADAMQGPYASLCLDRSACAIDVITAEGTGPFDEYTVLIDEHTTRLVVRIGNGWWFRELGPRDASVGAPRQHGDTISVRVGKDVVTCGLAGSGVPHCRV